MTISRLVKLGVLNRGGAIVSDTFSRSDSAVSLGSAETGQAWSDLNGTGGISATRAYFPVIASDGVAVVDAGLALGRIVVDVTPQAAGEGVVFNAADYSNFLVVTLSTTAVQLFKKDAGAFTSLGSVAIAHTFGSTYPIAVEHRAGGIISVHEAGLLVLSYTLTAAEITQYASNTKHGIRAASTTARFDNFRVSR